ncbi:MAG TPA: tetratricopeptide repeat protein [Pyrinomonadaceae bacterium]
MNLILRLSLILAFTGSLFASIASTNSSGKAAQRQGHLVLKSVIDSGPGVIKASSLFVLDRIPLPQQQPAPSASELRAQAYAKLLEGQRQLSKIRAGAGEEVGKQALGLARQAFQEAARLDPTLAEAHTALAQIAFYYPPQDFDAAAVEGVSAARVDPDNFGAHQILSRLYTIKSGLREGSLNKVFTDNAIKELKEVGRLDKNYAEGWALLAEFYQATGRTEEALSAYASWAAASPATDTRFFQYVTNGRELTPDAAQARTAELLLKSGRTKEALAAIRRALALDAENKDYIELLTQAIEAGVVDDNSAIPDLQRLVTANPKNMTALQLLARAQARSGHVDEAVALLRARIKGSPEDFGLHLMISYLYAQSGHGRDAVAAARKALELAPSDRQDLTTQALLMLSSAQEQAGDVKDAEESLRRILVKEPDNATALNNLGYFLTQRNERLAEALEMIRRAVKAEPDNASFLDSLGWVYFKLGQLKEAEENLGEAARRNTTSATIQEHLGDVYQLSSEPDKARTAWKKALSLSVEPAQTARLKAKLNSKAND